MTAPEAQPDGSEAPTKPLSTREKAKLRHMPQNDPLIGQVIGGHYEVLECIGKGGMSVVYKCRHQLINQYRAVKILLPHRDGAADFLLRFQLEATAASRMDNKHIVRVHDFAAPEDSAPYLVMDFADGQGLGDEIDRLGRIPVKRSLPIFVQILDAMGHTHARGVIHRDLKPDNIILVNDEIEGPDFVKLIDFGIAKLTAADKAQPQGLTPTGEIFGSPQYMSPEQCGGLTMDVRSEVYSLGCILYEMITGRAPLMGKSVLETLNMQAYTPPTPPSKLSLEPPLQVPAGLDDILLKCLAKKPADRYQTTEDLRKAITNLAEFDRRSKFKNAPAAPPQPGSIGLKIAALLASFIVGFTVARFLPSGQPAKNQSTPQETVQNAPAGEWESAYRAGQKALDEGDTAVASTKLLEALNKANGLDDGQKRAAATGLDLTCADLIKQFKSSAPDEVAAPLKPPQNYPDNPWETKVTAVTDLLRMPIKDAEHEANICKSITDLLEDTHKDNLNNLNELLNLAQEKLLKAGSLSDTDKLHLAVAVASTLEQQGYYHRAAELLKANAALAAEKTSADGVIGRYHLLLGRLALDQNDTETAMTEGNKAEAAFDRNMNNHGLDMIDVLLLFSDITLKQNDTDKSLKLAQQALASVEASPPSERLALLKDKLLLRASQLDAAVNLSAARGQCISDLEQQESAIPKDVDHLITALHMSYCIEQLDGKQSVSGRSKLWRAMALAYTTGRMGLASELMQPLMLSYDTPLTQKDLVVLAFNRMTIDEALERAGNPNGPDRLLDYITLGESLEDFSLGAARDTKKAKGFVDRATTLSGTDENRSDSLTLARVLMAQARAASEKKLTSLVDLLIKQSENAISRIKHTVPNADRDRKAADLTKKLSALKLDNQRPTAH